MCQYEGCGGKRKKVLFFWFWINIVCKYPRSNTKNHESTQRAPLPHQAHSNSFPITSSRNTASHSQTPGISSTCFSSTKNDHTQKNSKSWEPSLSWTFPRGSRHIPVVSALKSTVWRCIANASRKVESATSAANASVAAILLLTSCTSTRHSKWQTSDTRALSRECLPSCQSEDAPARNHNAGKIIVNVSGREWSALRNASVWCAKTGSLTIMTTT